MKQDTGTTFTVHSHNEWDKLLVCIVGDATGAQFPVFDALYDLSDGASFWLGSPHPHGLVPTHVIEEANEDLFILADTLTQLGVRVLRPDQVDFSRVLTTYDWSTDGMYNYCPRDVLLVVGDMVIEAPMALRSRHAESISYTSIKRAAIKSGTRWIAAPRPRLLLPENRLVDGRLLLTEEEPIFDAANVIRLGHDILYLVSSTGNILGAKWLQSILGNEYKVHVLQNVYSGSHLDSTITVLREGVVVLNASRIRDENCPRMFDKWQKVWVHDVVAQDIGPYPYASKWIALNMLSVDPNTIIVDKNQSRLIQLLERLGFETIPLELRHSRTLGGGFHCVTLDLFRDGDGHIAQRARH